jgi:hypothetical protein
MGPLVTDYFSLIDFSQVFEPVPGTLPGKQRHG